jgi:hypothetical protein
MNIPEMYQNMGWIDELTSTSKGYKKKDILMAMDYCSKLEGMDQGDELIMFLDGIKCGKKEAFKQLRQELFDVETDRLYGIKLSFSEFLKLKNKILCKNGKK